MSTTSLSMAFSALLTPSGCSSCCPCRGVKPLSLKSETLSKSCVASYHACDSRFVLTLSLSAPCIFWIYLRSMCCITPVKVLHIQDCHLEY